MNALRSRPVRRENFRRRSWGWRELLLAGGIALSAGVPTAAAGAPLVLSDQQLDLVTAGGASLEVDLAAVAAGSRAAASATGTARSVDTAIQLVQVSPRSPGIVTLIGNAPATLFFATGSAAAAGSATADCSGRIETSGNFAYLTEASVQLKTSSPAGFPVAVNCNCAAFGITLNRP